MKPIIKGLSADDYARASVLFEALEPQRVGYTAEVYRFLNNRVEEVLALLEKAGGDANKSAPYPGSSCSRESYHYAVRLYKETRHWTVEKPLAPGEFRPRNMNSPEPRVPRSQASIAAELLKQADEITQRDFESYTQKLSHKIGKPIATAKIHGKLWQCSILIVTIDESFWLDTERSELQRWSTKMILNFSKLGTPYNQWPTRRIDLGAPEKQ